MLIEFSVKNYRSYKDRQRLSLIANPGKELAEENTIILPNERNLSLLKSAVIYGPNAAGKSNLLRALYFMQQFILNSTELNKEPFPIDCDSFFLDSTTSGRASEFEIIFINEGVLYQYGFAVTNTRVYKEWLTAFPEKRPQQWFIREYNNELNKEEWKFGSKMLGGRKIELWKEMTRSDALFLSTATQLNNEQLAPLYLWFKEHLTIFMNFQPQLYLENLDDSSPLVKLLRDDDTGEKAINFIKNFELGITGIKLLKNPGDSSIEIYLIYLNEKNQKILFHAKDASEGTRKLLALIPFLFKILKEEKILIIDEIGNSLHPLLMQGIFRFFQNTDVTHSNAQMICSTHDVSLLNPALFRRDQIWFVEKKIDQSTDLYSLADFSPRKYEAFGKGYLEGRYGALPFIGEWKFDE